MHQPGDHSPLQLGRELLSPEPGPQAVRRLLTELMDIENISHFLADKITAIGDALRSHRFDLKNSSEYDFGSRPDVSPNSIGALLCPLTDGPL